MSSTPSRASGCLALSPPARPSAASPGRASRRLSPSKCRRLIFCLGSAILAGSRGILCGTIVTFVRRPCSERPAGRDDGDRSSAAPILTGLTHAFKSPYLINVSVFLLLFAITSTFLYFQQAEIARKSFADRGARTAFFARVDLWVNILTLGAQLFLTGRTIKRIGVGADLGDAAAAEHLRFRHLAWTPTIAALVAFQVMRGAPAILPSPGRPAKCCSPSCRGKISTKPRVLSIR